MADDPSQSNDSPELWRSSEPEKTQIHAFQEHAKQKYNIKADNYHDLWQWSVDKPGQFWEEVWHYTGIKAATPYEKVFDDSAAMFPKPAFFPGCTLNFAENLLFPPSKPADSSIAIYEATETTRKKVTWGELRERVRICAAAMEAAGVTKSERVAGYLSNHADTVIAMLAATSLGAIWTGISPDTGVSAVLDRLQQVEPVLLLADNAVQYNQKTHPTHSKISQVVSELASLRNIVVFETIPDYSFDLSKIDSKAKIQTYEAFISHADTSRSLTFLALPPEHPVYILYSSGTTGTPKPIVHASLGTLLQHKKRTHPPM